MTVRPQHVIDGSEVAWIDRCQRFDCEAVFEDCFDPLPFVPESNDAMRLPLFGNVLLMRHDPIVDRHLVGERPDVEVLPRAGQSTPLKKRTMVVTLRWCAIRPMSACIFICAA